MNQLVKTQRGLPTSPNRELGLVNRIVCWIPSDPKQAVELTRPLSANERDAIERRGAELESALGPSDAPSVRAAIAVLMAGYPSMRATGEDAMAVIAAYQSALADLPTWAIIEAADRWRRGQVSWGQTAFPPSTADMHKAASEIAVPFRAELFHMRRLLAATVKPPAVPMLSREKRDEVEAATDRRVASAALAMRAAEMGIDLSAIPDAKPRSPGMGTVGQAARTAVDPVKSSVAA